MKWHPPFDLDGYELLLCKLICHGYELLPVEAMPERAEDGSRVVFLRHDVDAHLTGIDAVASVEEGCGARSTWMIATGLHYNPGWRPNREIIQRLYESGHRIGIHYVYGQPVNEAEALEWLTDVEASSGCAHQPASIPASQKEIDNSGSRPDGSFSLMLPHAGDFARVPYISDSRREWRDDAIARLAAGTGPAQSHLNTHPEHWIGPRGETREQCAARITAQIQADAEDAAEGIIEAWHAHAA